MSYLYINKLVEKLQEVVRYNPEHCAYNYSERYAIILVNSTEINIDTLLLETFYLKKEDDSEYPSKIVLIKGNADNLSTELRKIHNNVVEICRIREYNNELEKRNNNCKELLEL